MVDGVAERGAAAMDAQRKGLDAFRERLRAIDASSWSVPEKVDYLLVWAKLNALAFDHRVMKPWARDPILYLDDVSEIPYASTPLSAEKKAELAAKLANRAEGHDAGAEESRPRRTGSSRSSRSSISRTSTGSGRASPIETSRPPGPSDGIAICAGGCESTMSDLVDACQAAVAAVSGVSRLSPRERLTRMPQSAAVGMENFNWYLKHVRLLPYDSEDLILLGERELHRYRLNYVVDRNRNRNLPELDLTKTREQHEERTREAEEQIRAMVAQQKLMTIPPGMPESFETDVFWSPRAATKRHFWEELQFRNALDNHIHASIPGHRFDGQLRAGARRTRSARPTATPSAARAGRPISRSSSCRRESRTRTRARGSSSGRRSSSAEAGSSPRTGMHAGKMSLDEANDYMIDWVPFMEEDLGRYDLVGYLRRPGAGSAYLVGKMQIEKLLSERAFQLGEAFDLGKFHDEFLSKGIIPVTLIRWEMTGHDDEVTKLWSEVVGAS